MRILLATLLAILPSLVSAQADPDRAKRAAAQTAQCLRMAADPSVDATEASNLCRMLIYDFRQIFSSEQVASLHLGRARAKSRLGEYHSALEDLDFAHGVDARSAAILQARSSVHAILGNWEQAARDLEAALPLCRADPVCQAVPDIEKGLRIAQSRRSPAEARGEVTTAEASDPVATTATCEIFLEHLVVMNDSREFRFVARQGEEECTPPVQQSEPWHHMGMPFVAVGGDFEPSDTSAAATEEIRLRLLGKGYREIDRGEYWYSRRFQKDPD